MSGVIQTTVQGYPIRTGPGGSYIPRRAQGIQALALWKGENPTAPDNWLRQEIGIAFQQLVCLALDGAPAAEMLPLTAEMWVSALGWDLNEEQDRERIRGGFGSLFRKLKRWPQPVELLAELPTRMKARTESSTMEAPISDEAHARGKAAFEDIMGIFTSTAEEVPDGK